MGLLESYAFYLKDCGIEALCLDAEVVVVIIDGVVDGVSIHVENASLNVYHWETYDEVFNAVLDIAEKLVKKAVKVTYKAVKIDE